MSASHMRQVSATQVDARGGGQLAIHRYHGERDGSPITRQRRGCLTCRKRKKKCHQQYPVCSHCYRLNLVCRWEGPRDVSDAIRTSQSTETLSIPPSSGSRTNDVDLAYLGVPNSFLYAPASLTDTQDGDMNLISSRRMMLRYYSATLVFMLTNNLQNNCFLSVLLPMAFECPPLMYALAACSSAHLALQHSSFRVAALQHGGIVLAELSASMSKGSLNQEMSLAISLVLCSMESISSGTDNWTHHLSGAAAALQRLPDGHHSSAIRYLQTSVDPKAALLRTYEGCWLLRNFAYHDIIMSVSLNRRPLLTGDYWLSNEVDVADPYFGLAAQVVFLIGEISNLNADFVAATCVSTLDQEVPCDTPSDNIVLSELFCRAGRFEAELQNWCCPLGCEDESLMLLAEAYRHAALIHLHRVSRCHTSSKADSLKTKIQDSVAMICAISKRMASGCYAETSMIFPLFMAGGEADIPEEVRTIRERLYSLNSSRKFRNVDAAIAVLDEVWRSKVSDTNAVRLDWLTVARRRGWKLALF